MLYLGPSLGRDTKEEALDQIKVVEKVLGSLSIEFHTTKIVLDLGTLTLDDLEGELYIRDVPKLIVSRL